MKFDDTRPPVQQQGLYTPYIFKKNAISFFSVNGKCATLLLINLKIVKIGFERRAISVNTEEVHVAILEKK